jgi:hypothetical protein
VGASVVHYNNKKEEEVVGVVGVGVDRYKGKNCCGHHH